MATPVVDYIVVRLIPVKPCHPDDFKSVLQKLEITAYDLTVGDTSIGIKIGHAGGLCDLGTPLFSITDPLLGPGSLDKSILQNFTLSPLEIIPIPPVSLSVGTAVIAVAVPLSKNIVNLRLEFTIENILIGTTLDYNTPIISKALVPDQLEYTERSNVATYFALPLQVPESTSIQLSSDGTPPNFDKLRAAVNLALDNDASQDEALREHVEVRSMPLTAAQSREIASVITWDRSLFPLPEPNRDITQLYTLSLDPNAPVDNDVDNSRRQFEGDLSNYHTIHDTDAAKLANFVFALSAAIQCERLTATANQAGFSFPVETGDEGMGTTLPHASVALTGMSASIPDTRFAVPAAFFYALGASYPIDIAAEQRYNMAKIATEDQLCSQFQKNIDSGNLTLPANPMTYVGSQINFYQAARRLVSLGFTNDSPIDIRYLTSAVTENDGSTQQRSLITDWLAYDQQTSSIDANFWKPAVDVHVKSYLNLLLQVITNCTPTDTRLVDLIESDLPAASVKQLANTTSDRWKEWFLNAPAKEGMPAPRDLLPDFTLPGNDDQRVDNFIQRLRKFFIVDGNAVQPPDNGNTLRSGFPLPAGDLLLTFMDEYSKTLGKDYLASDNPDSTEIDGVLLSCFPNDPSSKDWLKKALFVIYHLFQLTNIQLGGENISKEHQFSLMEALYSRGFTLPDQVASLSLQRFQRALVGSISYPRKFSEGIYAQAKNLVALISAPKALDSKSFSPVNPGGSLQNRYPPAHLSPTGRIAYLHDLLAIPLTEGTLGDALSARRGPLGTLKTSASNASSIIPTIDLVNESLEAIAANVQNPAGAVFDTNETFLNQNELLLAIPEHSSPSQLANSNTYSNLARCFMNPNLPYSQPIDMSSSYLSLLGTSRFEVLQHFRRDVSELAIDASLEPPGFQRYRSRYPVRLEIALAYLNILPAEYSTLFQSTLSDAEFLSNILGMADDMLGATYFTIEKFLEFFGLDYEEFLGLWRCGYVPFASTSSPFPISETSDLGNFGVRIEAEGDAVLLSYRKIAIFTRVWRSLKGSTSKLDIMFLGYLCTTFNLFNGTVINTDFPRQLAAFLMLTNKFDLPLSPPTSTKSKAYPRLRAMDNVLAIWTAHESSPPDWDLAVDFLLDQIEKYSKKHFEFPARKQGFRNEVKDNLQRLSILSGFTDLDQWYSKPTCTIRFAEIIAKFYASDFSVGEVLFLFTLDRHLLGDDPFPMQDTLESSIKPFELPDDTHELLKLRERLLGATVEDVEVESWTWRRIEIKLTQMRFVPHGDTNLLTTIGEHFFHEALQSCGYHVDLRHHRFEIALASTDTNASLWDADQNGPFHYDTDADGHLWTTLPICEKSIIEKLINTRQLNDKECTAVQDLYFAPRSMLAPLGLIFKNFPAALCKLLHEPSAERRFEFFRKEFALFIFRCEIIAEHLANHVSAAMDKTGGVSKIIAWEVLQVLVADENKPLGQPDEGEGVTLKPKYTWENFLTGGAFASLLGLLGTGLVAEYRVGDTQIWREVTSDLTFWPEHGCDVNAAVPTILPALNTNLENPTGAIDVMNGFIMRDKDSKCLGGAQSFSTFWKGSLVIDISGDYTFYAGNPRSGQEQSILSQSGHESWLVTLSRGQKSWVVVNHCWDAPKAGSTISDKMLLQAGSYHIQISFEHKLPRHIKETSKHIGFQIKYSGPDTHNIVAVVPHCKLFLESKNRPLDENLQTRGSATDFLRNQYCSSLRDIRRTYQRAFKSVLLVSRYELSAEPVINDKSSQSELQFLLSRPEAFSGTSYSRQSGPDTVVESHEVAFDFNQLPVTDTYKATEILVDNFTPQKESAWFDCWERLHDYTQLRQSVRKERNRECWKLFYEATEQNPNADRSLRYLGIDASLGNAVLSYAAPANTVFKLSTPDLTDERWSRRVWQSKNWFEKLKKRFFTQALNEAAPWSWAVDDLNSDLGNFKGNQNLTKFVQDCLMNNHVNALEEIKALNDGLRVRARAALLAFICSKDRISMPNMDNSWATSPSNISELLLQDVEVGLSETTTRIEDAIVTVFAYVQRIRLGLESGLQTPLSFMQVWDSRFSNFDSWKAARRRELYPENWIQWDELAVARRSESFPPFEYRLKEGVLSVAKPVPSMSWQNINLPSQANLVDLQSASGLSISSDETTTNSGLQLIGNSDQQGQLSLLSALPSSASTGANNLTNGSSETLNNLHGSEREGQQIPLWIQATVKNGGNFIRVAAAAQPFGSSLHNTVQKENVDEYYFWLTPSQYFDEINAEQNPDLGATVPDPACDWDPKRANPDKIKLNNLLLWNSQPIYYLTWCKIRLGEFDTPRSSEEGIHGLDSLPTLEFNGRLTDSLLFNVSGVLTFQYFIAQDSTTTLLRDSTQGNPQPLPSGDTSHIPKPLSAFPYFIYFDPGAPLVPLSNFSTAMSTALKIKTEGDYQASLKWFELAFETPSNPLSRENAWDMSSPKDPLTDQVAIRDRAVLLSYLETMVQWGTSLLSLHSPESQRQALVVFTLASKLLGLNPRASFLEDEEVEPRTDSRVGNFTTSILPLNPRLVAIFDSVAASLGQLNCDNHVEKLKYNANQVSHRFPSPLHVPHLRNPYRFTTVLSKAVELAETTRSLGSSLLSALERGDGEYLSSMQASYEKLLTTLSLTTRKNEFRETDWDMQSLEQSIKRSLNELNWTQNLIRNGNNSGENDFVISTELSLAEHGAAQGLMAAGQGVSEVPDIYAGGAGAFGSPLEFQKITGGSSLGAFFSFASSILTSQADQANTIAQLKLTQSGWDRRNDEWLHQVDALTIELKSLECQKLAADRRRAIALHETTTTQRQIEWAIEAQSFSRNKTTNFDLYLFLQHETASIYRRLYDMALRAAQNAQDLFHYERQDDPVDFIQHCNWDGFRNGLTAGEKLTLALRDMEQSYIENNVREYELIKQLSLNMHFPKAFLQLKTTGKCELAIPEWMFDLDYPGHYMRRIKSISLTVPCVVGPYTGIHCRLELFTSTIRTSPNLPNAVAHKDAYECQSFATDDRFLHLYGARESIATSTGMSDSGLFELNFRDERYLPFEFAGAVSKWKLELPPDNNDFDLDTLTDVIIQLNYTSREGGEELRRAASKTAQRKLPGNGFRLFDIRHDFADAWTIFTMSLDDRYPTKHQQLRTKKQRPKLNLKFHRNMFPFLTGKRSVTVTGLQVLIRPEEEKPIGSHIKIKYLPPGHECLDGEKSDESDSSDEEEEVRSFNCIAHSYWPGLLHGDLELELEIPSKFSRNRKGEVLLQFPYDLGPLDEIYILCEYKVMEKKDKFSVISENTVLPPRRVVVSPFMNSGLA